MLNPLSTHFDTRRAQTGRFFYRVVAMAALTASGADRTAVALDE
jgi:hypothetical protein